MFTNKDNGKFTGRVNAAVEPTKEVVAILENRGRLVMNQVRARMEIKKESQKCWNCYRFGHTKEDCTDSKKCRKCGQEGHIVKECLLEPGESPATAAASAERCEG